ncbi:MAG: hypothetical protein M5U31_13795 [Acidimicrobiia bacterium]|nr:hypothetical protein [Acidimicrobiia bacterium]
MTTPETTGTTTRVWRLREIGEPIDRLRLEEDVAPQPGPGEVAVDVDAVGLSFPDVLMCRGEYQMPTPDVYTPGGETAGGSLRSEKGSTASRSDSGSSSSVVGSRSES